MALMLLRVFFVGVLAAAADDAPIVWSGSARAQLPCAVPHPERLVTRRPPPPLDDGRSRFKPYLWRLGDEEINSKRVSPSGALEVSRRREGVYQCLARHQGGFVRGIPTHLKFASMEKQFSVHPANATARSGQPFVLSCSIVSSPTANVTWLKDGEHLPPDDRYNTIENQLLIADVTSFDEGYYRCVATNSYLNRTRISHEGFLKVSLEKPDDGVSFLPVESDDVFLVPRGIRVVMPCPVVGWPRPKLIWNHVPPGERTSELDVVDQVYVIHSLEADQEGIYNCTVEGYSHLYKTFTVTMTEPPVITIPPTSREALRASTVRFNCTAAGKPTPVITWYKDGQHLQMATTDGQQLQRINLKKSTDGQRTELVISGVTTSDAGVYQCFASNAAGVTSSWATLNVTGPHSEAPTNVKCYPVGDRRIKVTWDQPSGQVVAFTVHGALEEEKAGNSYPYAPLGNTTTEEIVQVATPLVPYRFQVRAYSRVVKSTTSTASDLSEPAVCQGQGVPIKLIKQDEDRVLVSWKQFAEENPGVMEWILQHKEEEDGLETNVTLDGSVNNYTLSVDPPLLVRVLGSRWARWRAQDLSLVPWASTTAARYHTRDVPAVPQDVDITMVSPRAFTVSWRFDDADDTYSYVVCVKSELEEKCVPSSEKWATFEDLSPGTEYEVKVQARGSRALGGAFSPARAIVTPLESPQRFKELSGRFINSSTLQVSWNGEPARYTVHYSAQLRLPVEQWDSVETGSNTVLIPGIDPSETTFLMVTGYDPLEHSKIETIPPLYKDLEVKDLQYEYTSTGVRVWWSNGGASGPRVVSYAQNITRPLEQWANVVVDQPSVELTVDPSLPTYVMVMSNKRHKNQVLTIEPRPEENSALYLGLGIGFGTLALVLFAVAAVFIWRKRKNSRSPVRSRRRNLESNDENPGEEAEMKEARRPLANGGARGPAAEPLLNGHLAAASKRPNGKVKKGRRYEAALDVSRRADAELDVTRETVLDASCADRPTLDAARPTRHLRTNNSFAKLPDDNMNSELIRSNLDNSEIQPTLQPNG